MDLSENQLGVAGAQALCAALKVNQAVQKIQLAGNSLEEKAAQYLAELLLVHTGLKSLDVSYNQLNDQAGNPWSGPPWDITAHLPLVIGEGGSRTTVSIHVWFCSLYMPWPTPCPFQAHRALNSFHKYLITHCCVYLVLVWPLRI